MHFATGTDMLECTHCGATRQLENARPAAVAIQELDFEKALRADLPPSELEEVRFSKCENCGAEIEFSEETHATECAFCATPIVTDTGTHRRIKPAALLPFAKSEREARGAMTKWLGKLWFAPNGLQEYARKGRTMKGIYVPFWTYDADTKSRYKGQRGTVYYETRTVHVEVDGKMERRQEQVQKIRWSAASGRVERFFDDILVLGATSLPKDNTNGLAPWDLDALEPYGPEYLAGFQAEGYTVALEEGYVEARAAIDRMIERDVRFDIGGDRQQISTIDTNVNDVTFKHILLPVWMAAYKYRGKTYRFVVNGRTGTVQGERPYSTLKITIAVVLGTIVAGAIGYFLAQSG
ncbi:MAG: ribosomal protein S27E [Paracoccaceae bacterium]|jgi:ribosomal protein S27E